MASATERKPREATLSAAWGGKLAYLEWSGEGTPLVLLHGLGGNSRWWCPLAAELPDRRILAVDMPGHGDTAPLDDWDMERTAQAIHDGVLEIIGQPAIWGGQSWGGKVAAIVAAKYPEDVTALVLMESAPVQGLPIPPETFVDMRYGAELGSWPSLSEATAAARNLPQYRKWSEALKTAFSHGLRAGNDGGWSSILTRERAIEIARNAVGMDHSKVVSGVKCPVALIVSEESLGWQEQTNIKAFPGAEKIVVPGGHWIQVDNLPACADAVRRSLASF